MGIKDLVEKLEPQQIKFFSTKPAEEGLNGGRKDYWIGAIGSEEEQVKTLLHELLHDLPKYKDKDGNMVGSMKYRSEFDSHTIGSKLHEKLDEESRWIYYHRPIIRNIALEKLRLAKQLPKNKWIFEI